MFGTIDDALRAEKAKSEWACKNQLCGKRRRQRTVMMTRNLIANNGQVESANVWIAIGFAYNNFHRAQAKVIIIHDILSNNGNLLRTIASYCGNSLV